MTQQLSFTLPTFGRPQQQAPSLTLVEHTPRVIEPSHSRMQEVQVDSGSAAAQIERSATFLRRELSERERTRAEIISHHWEGTVEQVGPEAFIATLRSLRDAHESEKEAEVPLDSINPDDLELLAPGAVFYWTIGYEQSPAGTRRRFSQLKFRRLPAWTKKDLARAERKADELFAIFGVKDADEQAGE